MTFEYGFDPTMSLQQMAEALREVRGWRGNPQMFAGVGQDALWKASKPSSEKWITGCGAGPVSKDESGLPLEQQSFNLWNNGGDV